MASKVFQFFKDHQVAFTSLALLMKLMFVGFTFGDAFAALVILTAQLLIPAVASRFPAQPDLFHEISVIQNELKELQEKSDTVSRDVSALKIGTIKQR